MKYIDEFRDPELARQLLADIRVRSKRPVRFMEFCGGHTHAIFRHGLRQMLPPTVELRSGPGCPVCVTAHADLDRAVALAMLPGVILVTFGDMLKVPGSHGSLQTARAAGADVRIVYSALDALPIARDQPERAVIFLGVGFETTAPTVAASVLEAEARGLGNYYVLSLHKLTPPATRAILDPHPPYSPPIGGAGGVRLAGIIGPGHVTTVIGSQAWEFLPRDYGVSCAVAGFEPLDILQAVAALVEMAETGRPAVVNAYSRSVRPEGNRTALDVMYRVFEVSEAEWRGLGHVPASGLRLRPEYARFDAALAYSVDPGPTYLLPAPVPGASEHGGCRCGDVLRGTVEPPNCPLFRRVCTPARPVGPCMVSAEGACAAWYRYGTTDWERNGNGLGKERKRIGKGTETDWERNGNGLGKERKRIGKGTDV
jgi:hydrogenase expression/formation protein HypD